MSGTRRVIAAAAIALGLGVGYWTYAAWPEWFGATIYLDAIPGLRAPAASRAAMVWPASRVQLEIPNAQPDDNPVPFTEVRQIGPVWPAVADPVRGARLMHGRRLYLQVDTRGPTGGGPALAVPISVSTTPVAGATNLAMRVTRATPSGRIELVLGPAVYPIPRSMAPDASVAAVVRVLPSGRYSIVSLVPR